MAKANFFDEFRKRYISKECKARQHSDCPLEVILSNPTDYPVKSKPCDCGCHEGLNFGITSKRPETIIHETQ